MDDSSSLLSADVGSWPWIRHLVEIWQQDHTNDAKTVSTPFIDHLVIRLHPIGEA